MTQYVLRDLIDVSLDGEWGKGEPAPDHEPMVCIRGTDFAGARIGNFAGVPLRHIEARKAQRKALAPWDIVIEVAGGTKDQITGRTLLLRPHVFEQANVRMTCASFSRFVRLRRDLCDPEYVFWYLQYLYANGAMRAYHTQHTGVARFQWTTFADREPLHVPTLDEQRRIARILSAYDELIENCERRIRVLDEMARALYREWFVLFRHPGHEKTPLVNSALGRIPKGWTHAPIRELYSGLFDGPHATPAPATEGPIFLGIGNMTESGRLDLSSVRHIAEADFDRWTKRVTPQAGDIVFTYEATLHRYALIPDDFRGCLGRRLALIRVDPAEKCGRFLFLTLLSEAWHEVVSKNTLSGATVDRVPLSKLPEFPILRPPMPLVAQFDDAVQPIIDDQMRLSKLIVNLRRTRDLLLPRLLSGQLAVEDAA